MSLAKLVAGVATRAVHVYLGRIDSAEARRL